LDGHSFSAHGLDGEFPGEEPVEAELLTARTMLVPEEVLGTGDAGTLPGLTAASPRWTSAFCRFVKLRAAR